MAVVIGEIVTETVVASAPAEPTGDDAGDRDVIVRRCAERVLETLRREWDA